MYKSRDCFQKHQIFSLADNIDFTCQKPYKAQFRGHIFEFSRKEGWKSLYETIIKELCNINSKILQDAAEGQTEFIISDEPVLWSVGNRGPAQNYDNSWWTPITDYVYIYTKNNTNKKITLLRNFFDLYKIDYSELKILLY